MSTGVYSTSYRSDFALRRSWVQHTRLALVFAVVAAGPWLANLVGAVLGGGGGYWLNTFNLIGIAVIGAVGLNILTGFTGQISLGHGGFVAVGAYTGALVSIHTSLPPVAAIGIAAGVTAVVGAFFGLPALRLKGLYLAIATLASQVIIDPWLVDTWGLLREPALAGLAIKEPSTFGIPGTGIGWTIEGNAGAYYDKQWYFVIAIFAAIGCVLATNLFRTGLGRAFIAIRDQDIAAEAIGVNTGLYKILSFALSSAFAGVAGALTAFWVQSALPESFTLNLSILYLAMIIIGGLGSVSGAVYGAIFIIGLPAWLQQLGEQLSGSVPSLESNLPAIQQVIFGLSIVLFLVFEPRGLARIWKRSKDYLRLWPFRY